MCKTLLCRVMKAAPQASSSREPSKAASAAAADVNVEGEDPEDGDKASSKAVGT